MVPDRYDMRPRCRSVSALQEWTCVDVVVGVAGHSARNYESGGVWYAVVGPFQLPPLFLFPCLLYPCTRERIRSTSEYRSSHITTSTGRYRRAYPCTESSGGGAVSSDAHRRVPQAAKATRRVPYRFLFSHWFPCNGGALHSTGYLLTAVLTLSIYTAAVLLLIQSGSIGASRDTPLILLLLWSVY